MSDSAVFIEYNCSGCGTELKWVYHDGELFPKGLRGCPGNNCSRFHDLEVKSADWYADLLSGLHERELSIEEAVEEYKSNIIVPD